MEFDYKKYSRHTKIKLVFMCIGLFLPFFILAFILPNYEITLGADLKVIRWIIFALFEMAILYKIILFIRIIKSSTFAKNHYIKLYDERTIFIKQKTGGFTLKLCLYLICLAAIVAGFYNNIVFYTLLTTIFTIVVSYIAVYLFYSHKF